VTTLQSARRVAVRPADKFDARRDELAESALETLGDLGYARTTLRQIASKSAFSHGVVHYYFTDKLELVIYSVRYYKARCVTRYDSVVAGSTTADGLLDAFAAKLAETIREEAPMHRLWYDLRTQSMFDEQLRDAVTVIDKTLEEMIWRVVSRYAELAGRPAALEPAVAYGMLDGLFQQALLAWVSGRTEVLTALASQVRAVLPLMLGRAEAALSP
jgi:AcrR family transcriptional regulator